MVSSRPAMSSAAGASCASNCALSSAISLMAVGYMTPRPRPFASDSEWMRSRASRLSITTGKRAGEADAHRQGCNPRAVQKYAAVRARARIVRDRRSCQPWRAPAFTPDSLWMGNSTSYLVSPRRSHGIALGTQNNRGSTKIRMSSRRRKSRRPSATVGWPAPSYSRAIARPMRSELVTMMPPDPDVMVFPRPRLNTPTSPIVPRSRPRYRPPIACAASSTTKASRSAQSPAIRSTSDGRPKRCVGTTQRVCRVTVFSRQR